ncbi:MAG: transporter substrate-binding domain-containing protein [Candidatus Accumulibacter sp.]|uniref:transporter substrate-binding domain-containing protein n=1 Tax=Accumulibacter sp. TaxID=2053492 RepID=UPI001A3C54DE|nr:transporter substrate-binding domain-containing protein [Accumulibacter sp.]MBL8393578.1 transporter substrate-binding domain-containing protein [Accumulibacter sp.]
MLSVMGRLLYRLSLAMLLLSAALAQAGNPPVRVATFELPPFVMEQGAGLDGFSIELWNEIAARLRLGTDYRVAPDVQAVLQSLRSGEANIAVSGLFYTSERDREFEFSYPILNAGLQIMVRGSGDAFIPSPLRNLLDLLFSRTTLAWLGVALLFIVVAGHVVWIMERRQEDGMIASHRYFPGIFVAMYWAASTLLTQAEEMPRQWLARTLAVLWMFVGISFVALYTAQLTASLTVQQIKGAINGPEDLPGKRVGTLLGGSAVAYLKQQNAIVQEFQETAEMYQALLEHKVDAVLLGAAGQRYYANHEGKRRVTLVGPEFNKNDVGFIFPPASPLRKRVNGTLLALREDGTYQRIYGKWFGAD